MTWLLLRGLARESRHWGEFAQELRSRTGQAVVTLDLPGNGALHTDTSPVTVNGLLVALRRQINECGLTLPINVLAMSLGGMVATQWAQHYPREVSRLVLINTSMRPFSSMSERLRPSAWPTLAGLALQWHQANKGERIENAVHGLTCRQAKHRSQDIADWCHIRSSAPVSASNVLRQLRAAARFTCGPIEPRCPVLVLSSKCDGLVNPICSTRLASAWQLPHHQHPWAGHDLPHDDGPWVCEQILATVAKF